MKRRSIWILFLGLALSVAWSAALPEALAREGLTLRGGLAFDNPQVCQDFPEEWGYEPNRQSCYIKPSARLRAEIRPAPLLLISGGLDIGGWRESNSYLVGSVTPGSLVGDESLWMAGWHFSLHAGAGLALDLGVGELRATAGITLQAGGNDVSRHEFFQEVAEVVFNTSATTALAFRINVEMDFEINEAVRLGPRLNFSAGQKVGFVFSDELDEELYESSRLFDSHSQITLLPGFGMSLPTSSNLGFWWEFGVGPSIKAYTAAQQREAEELDPGTFAAGGYDSPKVGAVAYTVFGVELRLGEAPE
ncbi:MAG: hypothetical protein VX498_05030 [Myxococcota bacterium]|nr:hypothetical protein [Myxococcota bacterium]